MKKIFALLLMVVMSVTLLAGCGTDPVQADLENFLNVEMTEVNADYTKITDEDMKKYISLAIVIAATFLLTGCVRN